MADLKGTSGNDDIVGTTLQDTVMGYSGHDTIMADGGNDMVFGSAGNDRIYAGDGDDFVDAGTGDDLIVDGAGNDTVMAGEGNDRVLAGTGNNIFNGGKGFDTIDFSEFAGGVIVDLSKKTATGADGLTNTVNGFEGIKGTSFDDNLKGSSGADIINAGNGSNVIRSLGGADDLTGGTGNDRFVFKTEDVISSTGAHRGVDTIHNFETNDTLDLRGMLTGVITHDAEGNSLVDNYIHLTDTAEGTMLQVVVGNTFVDVALLAGLHTGGATAAAWAGDGMITITELYEGGGDPLMFI